MSTEGPLRSGNDQRLSLIETFRYEPSVGCIRWERHVERMFNSAKSLGKQFDLERVSCDLRALGASNSMRIRLLLDAENQLSITTHPFTPTPGGTVWRVAISTAKLDATNPLLPHKTTQRSIYEAARAEFPLTEVDEVLLENQYDRLCEGTITSLFVKDGDRLLTPPISDGLLKGVLRQELLDSGKAQETTLHRQDIVNKEFFVGNSLRGLIKARLV